MVEPQAPDVIYNFLIIKKVLRFHNNTRIVLLGNRSIFFFYYEKNI